MSSSPPSQLRNEGTRTQVVLAGAIAGLISRFVIAPLDVLKIRLQLQYHSLADPLNQPPRHPARASSAGVLDVARQIFRDEGIRAFWKGNIPAEGLYLSYGAAQFLTYRSTSQALESLWLAPASSSDHGKDRVLSIRSTAISFTSGAVAGTAATTLTYPLDLLRTRFAAQGTEKVYAGLLASIREIYTTEGPRGFFRGVTAGVVQIVPYMGLFFSGYEVLKRGFAGLATQSDDRPPKWVVKFIPANSSDAIAGVTASILAKSAVFPLDTARKRLQIQGPTRARYATGARMPEYASGVLGTVMRIVKREGWRGLYRGLSVSLVKAAPASAVTMWSYERALGLLQKLDET